MIVRLTATGEERNVTPSQAKQLIECKLAVPVAGKTTRKAIVPATKVERR